MRRQQRIPMCICDRARRETMANDDRTNDNDTHARTKSAAFCNAPTSLVNSDVYAKKVERLHTTQQTMHGKDSRRGCRRSTHFELDGVQFGVVTNLQIQKLYNGRVDFFPVAFERRAAMTGHADATKCFGVLLCKTVSEWKQLN